MPKWETEEALDSQTAVTDCQAAPQCGTTQSSRNSPIASLRSWWRTFWLIDNDGPQDEWSFHHPNSNNRSNKLLSETSRASNSGNQAKKLK